MTLPRLCLTFLLLALGLSFSNVGEALEGNETHGGGTETGVQSGPAWFNDKNRVVHACVTIAPNFRLVPDIAPHAGEPVKPTTLSPAAALELVKSAHAQWIAYMKDRGVIGASQQPPELDYALELEVSAKCEERTDLRIYLGSEDSIVRKAKRSFHEPVGFAATFPGGDAKSLWRRGVIWISAPGKVGETPVIWTYQRLKGELLHELGHTFGNEHVQGTVMDEDLAENFKRAPQTYYGPDYDQDEIDQDRMLVTPPHEYSMSLDIDWGTNNGVESPTFDGLRMIMKRKHLQLIRSEVTVKPVLEHSATAINGKLTLTVDGDAPKTFLIDAVATLGCDRLGLGFVHVTQAEYGAYGSPSMHCQYSGTLTDSDTGESYSALVSENGTWPRFEIVVTKPDFAEVNGRVFFYDTPEGTSCQPNPACNYITTPQKPQK